MVVLVKGLKNHDFIARIGNREESRDHGFGCTAADGDFAFGIDFEVVSPQYISGR